MLITLLMLLSVPISLSSAAVQPVQTVITLTSITYSPVTTITAVSTQQGYIESSSFPVAPPTSRYSCNIIYDNFTAANAGAVSGTLTSDNWVDFYLVSRQNYNAWVTGRTAGCEGPSNALAVTQHSKSFSFNATLPKSGEYVGVFINQSKQVTANISWSIYSTGVVTYTETSFSALQENYLSTQSGTSGSQTVTSQQSQSVPIGSNTPIIVTVVIIVAMVAVAAFVYSGRGKHHKAKQATLTEFVKSSTSCVKCGAELPPKSKFCNSCGATQP